MSEAKSEHPWTLEWDNGDLMDLTDEEKRLVEMAVLSGKCRWVTSRSMWLNVDHIRAIFCKEDV